VIPLVMANEIGTQEQILNWQLSLMWCRGTTYWGAEL